MPKVDYYDMFIAIDYHTVHSKPTCKICGEWIQKQEKKVSIKRRNEAQQNYHYDCFTKVCKFIMDN